MPVSWSRYNMEGSLIYMVYCIQIKKFGKKELSS